ncbi:MAG: hypothetical protein HYY06_32595 [Deltaproteobacteria bacterium]|nr:hypothetical protein [Deltaproteobacteria bacterium]
MSRSRMLGGDVPEEVGAESPRTTIVGARPPEGPGAAPPVPVGIQRLLRLAAVDEVFRQELVARRAQVAEAAGVKLTATESAILDAIPAGQILTMAESVPVPEPARRDFLRQTAASAVVLLGGAALAACEACGGPFPGPVGGARPDIPPPVPPPVPPEPPPASPDGGPFAEPPPPRPDHAGPPAGIAPDRPPPRPDPVTPVAGIAPDVPPPRPETGLTAPGGARPDWPPEPEPPPPPPASRGHRPGP